ncbi:MAG: transposase [Opitutales bacterium]|nr:transposase [Opitutales bacterium]
MPRAERRGVEAVYHVVSRVCGRAFLFSDVEKEAFRGLLRRVAGFCGIEVITYALMNNHFHLLVEVPGKVGELSDEELLQRCRLVYGDERKGQPLSMARIEAALRAGDETRMAMRSLLMVRMGSLPMFMKMLKQRYSIHFNRAHDRVGTLWEDRFHSVLVENTRVAVRAVAAYIDLNPVRAGVVDDPKDYRFSGYGEAVGSGKISAYALFRRIRENRNDLPEAVAARYRQYLFVKASDPRKGRALREEQVKDVMRQGGSLSMAQLLRCRLRYMTAGVVIGSRAFVENWMRERAEKAGEKALRKGSVPSPAGGSEGDGLFALRHGMCDAEKAGRLNS